MLLCSVIILVLAILLSTYRTKQIVAPVNAIDLDHPMENDVYGELSPLLLRLQRQNETIKEKMEELHRKQTELLPSPKTCARLYCGGCKGRCAFVQHERCAPFGRAPGGRPPTERAGV